MEQIDYSNFQLDALRDTVDLIRWNNPALALSLQNRTQHALREARSKAALAEDLTEVVSCGAPNNASITVRLYLDPYILQRIIETLADVGADVAKQVLETRAGDEELLDKIHSTLELWLSYANQRVKKQRCSFDSLHRN